MERRLELITTVHCLSALACLRINVDKWNLQRQQ